VRSYVDYASDVSMQPYEDPINSDSASGAEDDAAVRDAEIEDPASDTGSGLDANDAEAVLSPSFGQDILDGDIW
jgi:hypothetical protein